MSKRARTESDKFKTTPEFVHRLITTHAETLVPPDNRIFVAQRTDQIVDVWKGLMKHNFSSVPILQKTKNKWYGWLDLADIVQFCIKDFGEERLKKDVDFWQEMDKEEYFRTRKVNDIMVNPGRYQPFHSVSKGYSLFSVAEIFANEKGVHRVPVIDQNRQLVNIITQSQFVRYLNEHMKELGSVKDRPVSDLMGNQNAVITISEDQPAIRAFQTMLNSNISGMGVVDANGKLVENISLRDLKAIQSDGRMFWRLNQTVKHFLEKIRKEFAKKR